ncbi:MAG: M20 family metallopeptidase [Firmicutes bacterium]|nr:M20 family metallopeptidase [Bacillota bacterium]
MAVFNKEEYMNDLEALVNIDSGSDDIDGLNRVADFICEKYESIGLTSLRSRQGESNRPYVEVYTHPDAEKVDVLFLGHLDTVFDKGTVSERPFTLSEDGKLAYGPGVGDMKAGDLMAFHLTRALREECPDLKICVCYNSDEETGSADSEEAMQKAAAKSRYGFVLEPGRIGGHFVYQRKGVADIIIKCQGVAAHAGNALKDGANAIIAMADIVQKLSNLTDFESGLTVSPGVIKGGTASNVVAAECEAVFDVRYTSFEQLAEFESKVNQLCASPTVDRVTVTWQKSGQMPPMKPNENTETMMNLLREEAEKLNMKPDFLSVGGASDGSLLSAVGCAVMDGCGPESDHYHSAEEYLRVDSIEERFNLLMGAIKRLA